MHPETPLFSAAFAALVAGRGTPSPDPVRGLPYLMLGVAGDVLGVPFLQVREVIPAPSFTVAPSVSPVLAGSLDREGRALPVFDLRLLLGVREPFPAGRRCVVLSTGAGSWHDAPVGVLVDAIGPVVTLGPTEIAPVGEFGDAQSDFLLGIGRVAGERRWLLDVDRLLPLMRPPAALRRG